MSKTTRVLFAAVACAFVVTHAVAQDDAAPSLKLGGGIRAGASGGDGEDNAGLNNVRLYLNGSVGPAAVEINTETSFGDENDLVSGDELNVTILDAVAKLTVSGSANVWVGRFLAPSDRANLSGPYYGNVGNDGPRASSFYYGGNKQAGRDDGVAVWGNIGGDMNLKYQVGIFDGADADDQMIAGRLVLNLWDNEDGYYNASTYYGEKQIFAIGLSYQDGAGSGGGGHDDSLSLDVLVEKTLDMGTATLDVAWYDYSASDDDPISIFAGLLMNGETSVGPLTGKLRPYIRYVSDGMNGDEWAVGVQQVIDGHNASVTVEYGDVDDGDSTFGIGAQFQF
ncbi:MAG: hypothetical protein VYB34_08260 [Planctomycetota bacterium]|nr:hypothetical protein [Planctomycetota bacterium]